MESCTDCAQHGPSVRHDETNYLGRYQKLKERGYFSLQVLVVLLSSCCRLASLCYVVSYCSSFNQITSSPRPSIEEALKPEALNSLLRTLSPLRPIETLDEPYRDKSNFATTADLSSCRTPQKLYHIPFQLDILP